jgi:hypothetical protein
MRKSRWLFFTLCLAGSAAGFGLVPSGPALAGLKGASEAFTNPSSTFTSEIKAKKKSGDGAVQQGVTEETGERSCPAGYVVLEKPNKYGAYCEPKAGLPEPPPLACKFGMIGTPPNDCRCPDGTEFVGYKGCVTVTRQDYCEIAVGIEGLNAFVGKCQASGGKVTACPIQKRTGPDELPQYCECCTVKVYEK